MTHEGQALRATAVVALLLAVCTGCHRSTGPTALSGQVSAGPSPSPSAATDSTTSSVPATTAATTRTSAAAAVPTAPRPRPTSPATRAPTTRVTQPPCPVNLAQQLADTHGAAQLVTVDAPSTAATAAIAALWQRSATGCWVAAGGPWPARVGFNGLSTDHREGDGTTPTGGYRISPVMYGIAPDPGVHGTYHQLVCGDWWDEDPLSPQYNSFQHVACGATPPFGARSEALWTETTASQRFAVTEYNTSPVIPGAGSAIFIHDDTGSPTNGCISLPPAQLDTLLRWLQPSSSPTVIVGTDAEIRRF